MMELCGKLSYCKVSRREFPRVQAKYEGSPQSGTESQGKPPECIGIMNCNRNVREVPRV